MALKLDTSSLGPLAGAVTQARRTLRTERVAQRLGARDHTLWRPDPDEISNRLGWLDSPTAMATRLDEIEAIVDEVRADGCTHAVLLGMGGSSLAPEVFRRLFGVADGYLDLVVLDSTDPAAVATTIEALDPARTVYVPTTKSGGTVETISFLTYCYNVVAQAVGPSRAGRQFLAITDPGSGLADLAQDLGVRHVFLNDPDIGGRYSALSCFGLVPARLGGVDVARLLAGGREAAADVVDDGLGLQLGAALGAAAAAGRDKLTLLASPRLAPVGVWIEQLIAESTGKDGAGILPVEGERLGALETYAEDRVFASLELAGASELEEALGPLADTGHPVVRLTLDDAHDVGGAMFAWEIATVVASHLMGIHPFDQPDVEAAKVLARSMMADYHKRGALPRLEPVLVTEGVSVYGDTAATSLPAALAGFLGSQAPGAPRGYVAVQAYLPSSAATESSLRRMQASLRDRTGLATTIGFGPRFLHSTGQLHKGDAGRGLFLQLTCDDARDLPIPDAAGSDEASTSFGVLKAAQAMGDRQALLDGGRRVLRLHIGTDLVAGLAAIEAAIDGAFA